MVNFPDSPGTTCATILIAAALLCTQCRDHPAGYLKIAGFTQGTEYHLTWESRNGENLRPQIESLLAEIDGSLSTYNPDSIISAVNGNAPGAEADAHLLAVLADARSVYDATDGAFDPTIAPLVNAYGFGSGSRSDLSEAEIAGLLPLVGLDKVTVRDGRLIKSYPEVTLDVDGIAQGYAVDVIARFLDDHGIANYMVEIGGEVRTRGRNPQGTGWRIGVDKPVEGNLHPGRRLQAILELHDRSLATSGNYRQFREVGGRKVTHSIDPRTGRPVESRLLSASILAPTCSLADAFATACMVMGLEKSITLVESREELEALFIFADDTGAFRTHATPGMPLVE